MKKGFAIHQGMTVFQEPIDLWITTIHNENLHNEKREWQTQLAIEYSRDVMKTFPGVKLSDLEKALLDTFDLDQEQMDRIFAAVNWIKS